ncbi:MAG: hypothetical protein J7J92_00425 [Candidatus Aenigmarchaeota archaeon]|nr:hypothetical protein [Candidatus Aenigmarchaeota archaeon]
MKKILALACLVMVLLVSGCTTTGRKAEIVDNNGLVINDFYIDPETAEANDEVVVHMEVENKGWTTATNVDARLYGTGFATSVSPSQTQFIGTMRAPDLYTDPPIPGDLASKDWVMTVKKFPEGNRYPFPLYLRVFYDYKTSGSAVITAYNEDEFKRRAMKQDLEAPIVVSNSKGTPVKVLVTGESPVKVDLDSDSDTATYRITISNVGDGVPITNDENGLVKGRIELIGDAEFAGCMGKDVSGKIVDFDVKLGKREQARRSCTIKFSKSTWQTIPVEPIQLMFELNYKYYIEKEGTVHIIGG